MGRMLQQHFWWSEIEKDAIWYVKSCHLCQIRQRIALKMLPVITHTLSIFQVLHTKRVQKGIAHWDKQNNDVPAPNCMLKVQREVIKDKSL